jgi:hypothetical protein
MANLNSLDFVPATRDGVLVRGAAMTLRRYLDIVIDGGSLGDLLDAARDVQDDLVTVFNDFVSPQRESRVRQLLLDHPAELPENRRPLFECPECGDVGCGVVSAVVELADNTVVWRDFGWETDYDVPGNDRVYRQGFDRVGPFVFDAGLYRAKLRAAMERLPGLGDLEGQLRDL